MAALARGGLAFPEHRQIQREGNPGSSGSEGQEQVRKTVFLDYTQDELDHLYDQRAWAPNAGAVLAEWQDAVAPARACVTGYAEHAYGDGPAEVLDLYPANATPAPIHIHIHGGAWRAQSKDDGAILAPAMTAAGMHFIVPDFDLLPDVRLPDMVEQLARMIGWVHAHSARFGGDSERIFLSGHSSGAHLAAVLATLDWAERGLPADVVKALVCVSGGYDLEAVLLSARRDYIHLSPEEAERLSPPRQADRIGCPVWVLWGEKETPEFIRQANDFAAALAKAGRLAGGGLVPGLNHFEICGAMAAPSNPVHHAVMDALAGLGPDATSLPTQPDVRRSAAQ